MKKSLLCLAVSGLVIASGSAALAEDTRDPGRGRSAEAGAPFAATDAAATGRVVAAKLDADYTSTHVPRLVGADARGQEYALSRGSAGVCLVGLHNDRTGGFEACSGAGNDLTVTTALDGGNIRTVTLQAHATSASATSAAGVATELVAPGLWVAWSAGTLPGN